MKCGLRAAALFRTGDVHSLSPGDDFSIQLLTESRWYNPSTNAWIRVDPQHLTSIYSSQPTFAPHNSRHFQCEKRAMCNGPNFSPPIFCSDVPTIMSSTLIYDSHFGRLRSLVGGFSQKLGLPVSYILLVFSFIVNFVCGVVISTVLPDAEVNNYFTDKRNVINRLFVKQGWLWTTIAVSTFYLLLARTRSKPDVLPAIGRYAVATISWVVFTQWFFGSPIMDKIFVATGGHCMVPSDAFVLSQHFSPDSTGALVSYGISSAQCRATRGLWRGGIDPSGHVFLLVHSMIYLFIEGSLLWDSWSTLRQGWVLAKRNHPLPRACLVFITNQPHIILLALLALWWWMLLMTNMYFHSALEKCGGLIGGIAGGLTWHYGARFYNTRSMEKL